MSRLGKLPIKLPESVQARLEDGFVIIKGPKGELRTELKREVKVEIKDSQIVTSITNLKSKKEKALWGLVRSLINNMVVGVEQGFVKKLEINGVGFKAQITGQKLVLNVGFSHLVEFALPEGISGQVEGNIITISGIDKQLVGDVAAQIRKIRKPEPYKGKGIKYIDEVIRRKESKAAIKTE